MAKRWKLHLPPLHPKQQEVYDHPARFKVLVCGRRWGKSLMSAQICIDLAVNYGKQGWFVSPTYNNVMTHWINVKTLIGDRFSYKNEQQKYLEFLNGDMRGSLSFKSGDRPDNLLGAGLDFVVLDEAAYQNPDLWFRVIRPSLSDRQGIALLISTPNGKSNYFYQLYLRGQDPNDTAWQSWRFPTSTNPYMPPNEVEQAKKDMTEVRFKQEYLAEFISDAGGVFHGLEKAASVEPVDQPEEGHVYVGGIDWGRRNDYTAISIIDVTDNRQVYLDRFTEIGYEVQRGRIARIYDTWKPSILYAEANSMGQPNIEALQNDGIPVKPIFMTNITKTTLVERLASYIEKNELSILSPNSFLGEAQLAELSAFEIHRTGGGRVTYAAAKGFHDDTVVALMLASKGMARYGSLRFVSTPNPFYGKQYQDR